MSLKQKTAFALQVGKPAAEGFRGLPTWTADVSRGWLTLWMKLPSKQHARAAFAEMLGHCPDVLATQISTEEAQQDDRQAASSQTYSSSPTQLNF